MDSQRVKTWLVKCMSAFGIGMSFAVGFLALTNGHHYVADLGDLLTGTAALLATAIAGLQFENWKERRKHERRAETAARALVAAVDVKNCLLGISRAERRDVLAPEDMSSGDIEFAEALQAKLWKREMISAFEDARVQAQAYLPDEIDEAMDRLWSLRSEMDRLLDTARLACGPHGARQPASDAAWDALEGEDMRGRIGAAYASVKDRLRPFALA